MVQILNILSVIIFTNNRNTIRFGKDVRRYMMCDVSHDFVGNTKYFYELSTALTPEAGECFFMYLTERRKANLQFNEAKIPMTTAKLEVKDSNLSEVLRFVKKEYIKKGETSVEMESQFCSKTLKKL